MSITAIKSYSNSSACFLWVFFCLCFYYGCLCVLLLRRIFQFAPPLHPQVQFMVWLPRLVHFSHPYPSEYLPHPTSESNTHRFDLVRRSLAGCVCVCVLTKGVDKWQLFKISHKAWYRWQVLSKTLCVRRTLRGPGSNRGVAREIARVSYSPSDPVLGSRPTLLSYAGEKWNRAGD